MTLEEQVRVVVSRFGSRVFTGGNVSARFNRKMRPRFAQYADFEIASHGRVLRVLADLERQGVIERARRVDGTPTKRREWVNVQPTAGDQ